MQLIRFDEIKENQYIDYIQEWEREDELIVPAISARGTLNFFELMNRWKISETDEIYKIGFVPSTLYFLIDDTRRIIGAIHFRHVLNEELKKHGGNIGYGIRKMERQKGYATQMLKMFLGQEEVKLYKKLLLTCDDDNVASIKTIESNGGIMEDKIVVDGVVVRRYWIENKGA